MYNGKDRKKLAKYRWFLAKFMRAEDYYHYSYFRTPSHQAEKCLVVSDGMGYTADKDFLIDRKSFYNYLAFYVRKGIFYVEQYGNKYVFKAGEGGLLNLMDAHLYYSDAKEIAHLLWFHFRGAGMHPLMEMLGKQGALPFCFRAPEMEKEFLEAFRLRKSGAKETEVAGHLYGTIMKILKEESFLEEDGREIPLALRDAVIYMENHLGSGITLEQLSKAAGMGKYHFSHLFKEWYGISPMLYYNNRKMEMACQLLKEGKYSIEEIADRMGYGDTGYFRKVFKNYFGVTPSMYKNTYLN